MDVSVTERSTSERTLEIAKASIELIQRLAFAGVLVGAIEAIGRRPEVFADLAGASAVRFLLTCASIIVGGGASFIFIAVLVPPPAKTKKRLVVVAVYIFILTWLAQNVVLFSAQWAAASARQAESCLHAAHPRAPVEPGKAAAGMPES